MIRSSARVASVAAAIVLAVVAAATPADAAGVPAPLRVAVFGDSSAFMTARGLRQWVAANPRSIELVDGAAYYGCGLTRDGSFRHAGRIRPLDGCGELGGQWSRALVSARPDVALIQVGPIEVDDHLLPGDTVWRAPGDPVFDAYLRDRMLEAVDLVLAHGVTPVWVTSPVIEPPDGDVSRDPARMARFNELLREVATLRPALRVVDLARFVEGQPGGPFDPALRPDGVHFEPGAVASTVAPWLVSAMRRALVILPRPR